MNWHVLMHKHKLIHADFHFVRFVVSQLKHINLCLVPNNAKTDFLGGLMTSQNFEDLPLHG